MEKSGVDIVTLCIHQILSVHNGIAANYISIQSCRYAELAVEV